MVESNAKFRRSRYPGYVLMIVACLIWAFAEQVRWLFVFLFNLIGE